MTDNLQYEKIEKLDRCNFSKTILMILVVFCHAIDFWTGTWFTCNPVLESKSLAILAEYIGSFHIYAFTLVSGYLFYYKKIEKGDYPKFTEFVIKKVKRLVIPYVTASLLWVIPISQIFFKSSVIEIIKKFGLGTSPAQLWFLLMLFWVFIIFFTIANYTDKHPIIGGVIVLAIYLIGGVIGSHFLSDVYKIWTACSYLPFFYIGFIMRKSDGILEKIPAFVYIIVDLGLFATNYYFENAEFEGFVFKGLEFGLNTLLHIIGAITAFVVLQKIASKTNWKNQVIKFIGARSMTVYLLHQQIIYFTIYWLNGKINPWLNAGVNFVIALIVSLLISTVLMKWKVTRIIIGEKA